MAPSGRSIRDSPVEDLSISDPQTSLPRLKAALADRYRIESEAGRGGMATVFLAADLRHDRQVALKVLHPELGAMIGAERFLQEIKVTAGLQHAHILPLHDSGVADGLLYYVMPYVEGETLRDVLRREKQLEIPRAVEIIRQIAAALDYAHRKGVIHRDIKPENILIHDGQAMVADFGIALAVKSAGGTRMTETGLSLGTPQYMSPEQAMGDRELDARSDVYSLGAVLYELLTGDPPHTGSTAQAIVAKIITEKAAPVTQHRETVPRNVAAAVSQAIAKLPADRFHTAAEFADALVNPGFTTVGLMFDTVPTAVPATPLQKAARWAWPAAAAVLAIVAAALWFRPVPDPPVARYELRLPDDAPLLPAASFRFALAPDASWLVYTSSTLRTAGIGQLFIKYRQEGAPIPLAGTAGALSPVSSPDGGSVAFRVERQLRRLVLGGGASVVVYDSLPVDQSVALAWGDDGAIYFPDASWRLRRIDAAGGETAVLFTPGPNRYANPSAALPDGRGVLFIHCNANCATIRQLWVYDARSGEAHELVADVLHGWYAEGHLIYVRTDGGVFAQPFDLSSGTMSGTAVPVLEQVQIRGIVPQIAASASGTLLMIPSRGTNTFSTDPYEAVWLSRNGTATPVDSSWHFDAAGNSGWSISPDGRRLAIKLQSAGGSHIYVKELDRGPLSRITFDSVGNARPRWTPDGRYVSYVSPRGTDRRQNLYRRPANGTGTEELVASASNHIWEAVWSKDGKWLVLRTGGVAGVVGGRDIQVMRIGVDTAPRPLLTSAADERAIALSPDSRWIAYESDESGRNEIYVRPFPNVDDGKWQVSVAGGDSPVWAHNGRELFYMTPDRSMTTASFTTSGGFAIANRTPLMTLSLAILSGANYRIWDVAPGDQRFLMVRSRGGENVADGGSPLLVQNWLTELRAAVRK